MLGPSEDHVTFELIFLTQFLVYQSAALSPANIWIAIVLGSAKK